MKKLSLKTYSLYTLNNMTQSSSVNVKKMQQAYQNNHRLYAPLLCYMYLKQSKVKENSDFYVDLQNLRQLSQSVNEQTALDYLKNSQNEELQKYYHSFDTENKRRDENEMKNRYRKMFKTLQKQLGLTDYRLCKLCNANSGNFNAFYNHDQNNKLSLEKCELLLEQLILLQ